MIFKVTKKGSELIISRLNSSLLTWWDLMAFISALASVISSEDTKAAPFLCPFVCFNLRLLPKFRKRINRKFSVKKLIDIVARDETTLRHTTKPLTALIIPSRKNKENHVLNHNNNNANNNNDNNNNNHPRLY